MTTPADYRPAKLLRYRDPAEFLAAGAVPQRHYEAHGATTNGRAG